MRPIPRLSQNGGSEKPRPYIGFRDVTDQKNAAGINIAADGRTGSREPLPKRWKHRLLHIAKHRERQNQVDAGVRVPRAPEIVSLYPAEFPTRRESHSSVRHPGENDP
jgi:hypothetical protein